MKYQTNPLVSKTADLQSIVEKLKPYYLPGRDFSVETGSLELAAEAREITTGLEAFSGEFDDSKLRHLLTRTTFCSSKEQIDLFSGRSLNEVVDQLLQPIEMPQPPVAFTDRDPDVPKGVTWVNSSRSIDSTSNTLRLTSLFSWWTGHMLNTKAHIREKMVLFWHNFLVTESEVIKDARVVYDYVNRLRLNALGNYQTLIEEITINPAMLRYLNGDQNDRSNPNENYARELFELFTIGKGPQIADGNYTHYQEQDVREAARALTGWTTDFDTISSNFRPGQHDNGVKTFSDSLGNASIENHGSEEYRALIRLIFEQRETARALCRKLYRWFVYYDIDDFTESQVIEPLATILIQNQFEIVPVLRALLSSEHFYDYENIGVMVKSPVDYLLGLVSNAGLPVSPGTDIEDTYNFWIEIYRNIRLQDMTIGSPPSVAGWPSYHQEPFFYRNWLNSVTLPFRQASGKFLLLEGIRVGPVLAKIDTVLLAQEIPDSGNPDLLINELVKVFFSRPLSQAELEGYKEVLRPGLPDFEWTVEWADYLNEPTPQKEQAVRSKLDALMDAIINSPQYQLQ